MDDQAHKLSFDRYNVPSPRQAEKLSTPFAIGAATTPYDWAQTISNSGRIGGDIIDTQPTRFPLSMQNLWDGAWPGFHCSVMNILNKMAAIQPHFIKGYYNDMDMLEVGNGIERYRYVLHFHVGDACVTSFDWNRYP